MIWCGGGWGLIASGAKHGLHAGELGNAPLKEPCTVMIIETFSFQFLRFPGKREDMWSIM